MNKKIYFNKHSILITEEQVQLSENQQIVDTAIESAASVKNYLEKFIQQTEQKDLILITKSVKETFELVKSRFTCIEAAGGLIRNKNSYLFIFRLGKWDLPKGKLDQNETPAIAAIRECEEECGISGLNITAELPSTYHVYPYRESLALKVTYWFAMQTEFSGKLIPQTEENIEKAEWLDTGRIKALALKNTYPAIADVIRTGIRL